MSNNQTSEEFLDEELKTFQDYTASYGYPMNQEAHERGLEFAKKNILQHFQQEQGYTREKLLEDLQRYTAEHDQPFVEWARDWIVVLASRDKKPLERTYTQSEVDRLIREELELLMDRYTKIARKNTSIAISPLIIANRLVELSKQEEGSKS